MSKRLRHLLLSLSLVTCGWAAPMPWAHLKVGMGAEELISLLGEPLMRCAARGFETWTYDDGAEVVVCGMVVGWTLPNSVSTAIRSQDIWRTHPKGDYLATLRTALREAGVKSQASQFAKQPKRDPQPAARAIGYEEYSTRG